MSETQPVKHPITVYAEATPNPESLKFVMNKLLVKGRPYDFGDASKTENAPLAKALFEMEGISRVFIANNFVTVTKTEDKMWVELIPDIRNFLKEWVEQEKEIITGDIAEEQAAYAENADDDDVVLKIKDLLNSHVRPAVEMDGGAIDFKGFDEGIVSLTLRGACSGCPSASLTLKSGIEALLKKMVPQVKEVVAEEA